MIKLLIQRLTGLLVLLCVLTGVSVAPSDYCIVDDNGISVRGQYTTIQAALNSGCAHIDVRRGTYPAFSVASPNTLIEFHNVIIVNNFDISVSIGAPNVTLKGDLLIQGNSTGQLPTGDGFHGVGVYVTASNLTIDGLKTSNLRSYSVYLPEPSAGFAVIRNFQFTNVCTDQNTNCCAPTAIMFINGASDGTVQNGVVTGHSMFGGTWYGSSRNTFAHNRALNNWGKIGDDCDVPRRIFENYGLGEDGNSDNTFLYNYIDGGDGAFEIADVIRGSVVQGNTVRSVNSHFGVAGSANNRGEDIYIIDNFFYCDGSDLTNWFSGSGWIKGNTFEGCVENNIGTIYVPSDVQGDGVFVIGNEFDGNGRVARFSGDNVTFNDNSIINPVYSNALYIDNGVKNVWIEDNHFYSDGSSQAVNSNGATNLTIRNNYVEGHFSLLAGTSDSVVSGNEIRSSAWLGLAVPTNSIVKDNRVFNDGIPVYVDGVNILYSLVADNFYAEYDGTPSSQPPNCGTRNRCRDNWTAGQVPP